MKFVRLNSTSPRSLLTLNVHSLETHRCLRFWTRSPRQTRTIALGYTANVEQPGRVCFSGDWKAVCRANLWLRTADRVLIEVLQFPAPDFGALFDTVKDCDWSQYLPADAQFPVNGRSRLSQLTSVPAVQRSVKKAIVEGLQRTHHTTTLPKQVRSIRSKWHCWMMWPRSRWTRPERVCTNAAIENSTLKHR